MFGKQLKNGLLFALLFLIGLGSGLAAFTPFESIWSTALTSLEGTAQGLSVSHGRILRASARGATINDVRLSYDGTTYQVSRLDFRAGWSPLVQATAETGGPILSVNAHRHGVIDWAGDVDLSVLLAQAAIQGLAQTSGKLTFDTETMDPTSGRFSFKAPVLVLPGNLRVENLGVSGDLMGETLNIRNLSFTKPVQLSATGTAQMAWANLPSSTYDLTGEITMGGMGRPFKKSGRLAELRF